MEKIKLKNLLKCGILLFGILLSLTNCSNDNEIVIEEKSEFLKGLTHQSFSSIKNISLVQEKTSRFIKSKNQFNRTSSDSITFTIDTTAVQVIESQIYTSYTFKADMFEEVDNLLNNYVLTIYNDNTYKQMLVTYPIIGSVDDAYYDVDNAIAEPIDGNIVLYARGGCDGYPVTSWNPNANCVDHNCGSNAHSGSSESGQCDLTQFGNGPTTVCSGAWVHDCEQAESIDAPDGPSGGGGGTTTTPETADEDDEEPIAIVPFDPRRIALECGKINNFLDNNTVNFTQLLQTLETGVNSNAEVSITLNTDNALHVEQGLVGSGGTQINPNPTLAYVAVAHIHDDFSLDTDGDGIGEGTFSVFSFEDLALFAEILYNYKLNSGTFVAFLATSDGTRYALTINDHNKFLDLFFMYAKDLPSDVNEINRWKQSQKKLKPLKWKYYDKDNPDRKISETDDDNNEVLKQFLTFLNDGDAGISLFEANSAYDSFQPVILNQLGEVDRTSNPCNN